MSGQSGFSSTYRHGVPWSTLRVEGLGASKDIPEIDFSESFMAHNEGCITLAVAPAEVEVEMTVATEGPPADQTITFVGSLSVPDGVLEVGDLVGDDFSYRFQVPSGVVEVVVSVDVVEEATRVSIIVPAVVGRLP
ncbi:hypothetical protein ACN27J_09725 [Solwaraspora sp. WMMB762]|uniref:hypothetical protein n=1 Tax=Solwaraspora sp. WMMB762 TaxID=3404120 RepID=UPI003B964B35